MREDLSNSCVNAGYCTGFSKYKHCGGAAFDHLLGCWLGSKQLKLPEKSPLCKWSATEPFFKGLDPSSPFPDLLQILGQANNLKQVGTNLCHQKTMCFEELLVY